MNDKLTWLSDRIKECDDTGEMFESDGFVISVHTVFQRKEQRTVAVAISATAPSEESLDLIAAIERAMNVTGSGK